MFSSSIGQEFTLGDYYWKINKENLLGKGSFADVYIGINKK